jgi:CxxC motif-containing protein
MSNHNLIKAIVNMDLKTISNKGNTHKSIKGFNVVEIVGGKKVVTKTINISNEKAV